jgi:hypothetical protein
MMSLCHGSGGGTRRIRMMHAQRALLASVSIVSPGFLWKVEIDVVGKHSSSSLMFCCWSLIKISMHDQADEDLSSGSTMEFEKLRGKEKPVSYFVTEGCQGIALVGECMNGPNNVAAKPALVLRVCSLLLGKVFTEFWFDTFEAVMFAHPIWTTLAASSAISCCR